MLRRRLRPAVQAGTGRRRRKRTRKGRRAACGSEIRIRTDSADRCPKVDAEQQVKDGRHEYPAQCARGTRSISRPASIPAAVVAHCAVHVGRDALGRSLHPRARRATGLPIRRHHRLLPTGGMGQLNIRPHVRVTPSAQSRAQRNFGNHSARPGNASSSAMSSDGATRNGNTPRYMSGSPICGA